MATKGKQKGNRNEYQVAEVLTEWWGKPFKRLPNSGALRWGGVAFTYGDLLPPEDFCCIIECKHYHKVDVDEVLRKDPTQALISWWWYHQVMEDVERHYKETGKGTTPLLIWKQDYGPFHLCFDNSLRIALNLDVFNIPFITIHPTCHDPFVMCLLEDFIDAVDPTAFAWACQHNVCNTDEI